MEPYHIQPLILIKRRVVTRTSKFS